MPWKLTAVQRRDAHEHPCREKGGCVILRDCYSGCIRVRREGLGRARGHTGETGAVGDELGMGQERVEASYQFLPLMEQLVSFLVALWSFVFLLQVLLEQCQKKRNFKLFTNSGHYIEVLYGNHVFFHFICQFDAVQACQCCFT